MIRYLAYLAVYLVALAVAVVVTPMLPAFATIRLGGINNDDHQGAGLRLPLWLAWFDTPDNPLTGDEAFERSHPNGSYFDMVLWLYRNPLYGFKWGPLGYSMNKPGTIFLHYDGTYEFHDAFQLRKRWLGNDHTFGWILDAYYLRENKEPKAIFVFWN